MSIAIYNMKIRPKKPKHLHKKSGPPKVFETTLLLRITKGAIADLDAVLTDGENRSDVIRLAIENEIERRCQEYER